MQWVSLQIGRKSAFIEFNYVRRQTPPGRSEVLPVLRLLQRDLKIALVLGVICIGVKGFFFGLLPGFLLGVEVKAAAAGQADHSQNAQKGSGERRERVFLRFIRFGGFLSGLAGVFLGFQSVPLGLGGASFSAL